MKLLAELLTLTEAEGKTVYVAVPRATAKAEAKALPETPVEAYYRDHGWGIDYGSHEAHRDDEGPGPVAKCTLKLPDSKILLLDDEDAVQKVLAMCDAAGIKYEGDVYSEPWHCAELEKLGTNGGGGQLMDLVFLPKFMKELKAAGYETLGGDRTIWNGSDDCVMIVDPSQIEVVGYQDGPPDEDY